MDLCTLKWTHVEYWKTEWRKMSPERLHIEVVTHLAMNVEVQVLLNPRVATTVKEEKLLPNPLLVKPTSAPPKKRAPKRQPLE